MEEELIENKGIKLIETAIYQQLYADINSNRNTDLH